MESDAELREHLRVADRAAAAPWIDYPPTLWWHYPLCGLWAAAMVSVIGGLRHHAVAFVGALAVLMAAYFAYIAWYRRYRGALPHGRPPREVAVVLGWYAVGYLVVFGLVALVMLWAWAWAAVVAFALAAVGLVWYESVYGRAAARIRRRLG